MGYPNMGIRNVSYEKTCVICGASFTTKVVGTKYCSKCNPSLKENRFKTHRDKPLQFKPIKCKRCQKEFIPTSSSVKYCGDCKVELKRLHNLRKPILKCRCCGGYYTRLGMNQKRCPECRRVQNTGQHRIIAFENLPHICNHCGKEVTFETSQVHHKDRNPKNNSISNLEILCVRCHRLEHVVRDPKTGKIITNK